MGSCGPLAQDAMGVFWNVLDLHTGHGAILALLAPICKWLACCIVSPSSVSFLYKCTSKEEEAPPRPARNLCRINRLETLELDRLKWLPVPGSWALRRADPGQKTVLEIALRLEGGSRRGFASMMKGFDHVPYSSPPVITDEILLAAFVALAALLLAVPSAAGDTVDQQYLAGLDANHIPYATPDAAILVGHRVADSLTKTPTMAEVGLVANLIRSSPTVPSRVSMSLCIRLSRSSTSRCITTHRRG